MRGECHIYAFPITPRRLGGAHPLFRLDIFWVWVAGDPCLMTSPELSHVAGAITIPEIIQIVGPDLHHFRSLIDECSAVICPP